jgi:drug/metabolite transporter (DMT)-like permease
MDQSLSSSSTKDNRAASPNPDWIGSVAVLVATACWGTSGVFISLILATEEVSVLALNFWRDLMTFLILLVGLRLLRPARLQVKRGDLIWLGMLGASMSVLHVVWSVAVLLNGAAVATVQQAVMPAMVAAAAWLIWGEPLTGRKVLAIILTFAGTVFVSGLGVLGQAHLTLSGFLVGLGLPTLYAGWNLFMKRVRTANNLFATLTYSFGFGTLVLLPLQFFTPQPHSLSPTVLLYFMGLILVATVAGFTIYTFAVGRLQASVATILAMAEIPVVAVYAFIFLGERLSIDQILGAVLVTVGVLMLSLRRRK